jgi:hypothetical protein
VLGSLTPAEYGEVLSALLVAHPELEGEAERIARERLSSISPAEVAADVESALAIIPLDDLAARAGRVRGRGYVHETDAAWELVEETMEPFRADLERRATLGLTDAATDVLVGIVAGLYRMREPEMGTVLAYAGEDTPDELASCVMSLAAKLGLTIPDDTEEAYWPEWADLR